MKNLVLVIVAVGSVMCVATDTSKNKTAALVTNATTETAKVTAEPPVIVNNVTENIPNETTVLDTTVDPIVTTSNSSPTIPPPTTIKPITKPTVPTKPTPPTEPPTKPTPPTEPPTKPTAPTEAPTTSTPSTTASPHKGRHFDGPSFIGGIILATGLMAIGFVAFKFYRARTERNYHTL